MSANNRAVITVQVGHYSNFIGTHFWNCQDWSLAVTENNDIDHDVLFREGLTPLGNQVTYTPRLVSLDLKGALGSLPEFGDLYYNESVDREQLWQHSVEVQRSKPVTKTSFLKSLEDNEQKANLIQDGAAAGGDVKPLESEVKVWSDFLRARYHPKTNVVVDSFHHGNENEPFDVYGLGESTWNDSIYNLSETVEDRVRFFAEEADSLKGFQLMTDASNAFGGISSKLCNYLRDDYNGQCVLAFPCLPSMYKMDTLNAIGSSSKMLNTALSMHALSENCDLVTPMSLGVDTFPLRNMEVRRFRHFDYDSNLHYHSAAILSCAFDAMTLPWRQLKGSYASPSEVQNTAMVKFHPKTVKFQAKIVKIFKQNQSILC